MKLVGLLVALSLLFSNTAYAQSTETAGEFDDSKVTSGTIGARYSPDTEKRIKARIQNNTDKYDYDLFGRAIFEYFPLQLGNGEYKISIFENISGTRYRQVKQKAVNAELKNDLSVYLASVQTINWDTDMAVIKKAAELTKGLTTDQQKIEAIYKYIIDTLSYDYDKIKKIDTTYVPAIDEIIKDGKGICYDYSAVFAAMLRSQNIPAKLLKGYSDYVKEYHAWNEVYLADKKQWMVVDTTYDSVMKHNKKSYKMEKDGSKYKANRVY